MKFKHSAVVLMAAAMLSLSACGKRDREEAKKTSDGSDTFVYVKPDLKKYAKKAPPSEVGTSEASATATPETQKMTGSITPPADRGNE